MPRCIAPGCTSGYKSNPEKVHSFAVPKDQDVAKLWQDALRRRNFVVRPGQFVCEKHFLAEDILWKRELIGPNGQVLGVSHYKQPRLRKGAVPSQFPWTEIAVPQKDPAIEDRTSFQGLHENIRQYSKTTVVKKLPKLCFANLVTCKTLRLPANWTRHSVNCDGVKIESFVTFKCSKIENSFVTVNTKELIVQEDLKLKVNVLCRPFDATTLSICTDTVCSIKEIEDTVRKLDAKSICCGFTNNAITYNSNISYVDIAGTTRHKQCVLLLSNTQEKKCTFCKRLQVTLKETESNMKNEPKSKRLRLLLPPEKQETGTT